MTRIVRRVGIAIGSLLIAYLAVSLVGGILLGPTAIGSPLSGLAIVVLSGLIFADIIRRERPKPAAGRAPTA